MIDIIRSAKTSRVEGRIYVKNLSSASPPTTGQPFGNASFSGVVPVATGLSQVEVWKFKTPELNLDESTPPAVTPISYRPISLKGRRDTVDASLQLHK
jgi:hypothetical protein